MEGILSFDRTFMIAVKKQHCQRNFQTLSKCRFGIYSSQKFLINIYSRKKCNKCEDKRFSDESESEIENKNLRAV